MRRTRRRENGRLYAGGARVTNRGAEQVITGPNNQRDIAPSIALRVLPRCETVTKRQWTIGPRVALGLDEPWEGFVSLGAGFVDKTLIPSKLIPWPRSYRRFRRDSPAAVVAAASLTRRPCCTLPEGSLSQ